MMQSFFVEELIMLKWFTSIYLFIEWVFVSDIHDGEWKGCGILFNNLIRQSEKLLFINIFM